MPIRCFKSRIIDIFHEPPSWAELISSICVFIYVALAIGSECFTDKDLADWPSMSLIALVFNPLVWISFSFACAVFQLTAVVHNKRTLRLSSSVALFAWYIFLLWMNLPQNSYSPMLAFPIGLSILNFLSIARHSRDWHKDILAEA